MLTLVVVFLALTLGRDQADNLSVVGKIMVVVITLIYLVATIYCAVLCWKTDSVIDSGTVFTTGELMADLKHQAEHVAFAANECPYVGLLGAITGVFIFMQTGLGPSLDVNHIEK